MYGSNKLSKQNVPVKRFEGEKRIEGFKTVFWKATKGPRGV